MPKRLTEEELHEGLGLGPWIVDCTDYEEWMIKGENREVIQYVGMGDAARARTRVIVAVHNLELKQTREENQRLTDQVDDLEDYVSTLEEDIRNLDSGD